MLKILPNLGPNSATFFLTNCCDCSTTLIYSNQDPQQLETGTFPTLGSCTVSIFLFGCFFLKNLKASVFSLHKCSRCQVHAPRTSLPCLLQSCHHWLFDGGFLLDATDFEVDFAFLSIHSTIPT